ncbi:hypothetical protein CHGG_08672 [Chaetomium globosum CBS 148.51]|uniref:Uncharacterized protein n=1 Tax=Chaetomium globosum (strain ATCC 6205 / CBS 148.51 / DSM 1962 / NBRC 6347 / NRRL 1970) TaxID=306901 RepID=Q2GTN2_CHAGB|nr:uncharacterized protein CHGG_08672 [Chaetomium globosum CBS 148.51]EAQ84658.1 hypothetical protein CHGG_08672 [Chaetomium globosum CBS 148.51]
MSSSNSAAQGAGKRKRNNTSATLDMDQNQTIQNESRDASGEEGDTTAPESSRTAANAHRKTDSSSSAHPNKRQRASSDQLPPSSTAASAIGHHTQARDPGEPSDTTEASVDIAERVTRKGSRKLTSSKGGDASANGSSMTSSKTTAAMAPPPIGKLTHPGGIHDKPASRGPGPIVRDYEKYIARQLKRGTSRQELNISWLKKNELELKRHVQDLRDNIRTNWTTTGQELSRELRQYWPTSRPQSPSPARFASGNGNGSGSASINGGDLPPSSPLGPAGGAAGGSAFPFPRSPPTGVATAGERATSTSNDFVTGYTLGLIGGVRSWMTKSRRGEREGESRPVSDDDSEESEDKHGSDGRRSMQLPATSQRG